LAYIVEFEVVGLAGRQDLYSQRLNRDVNVFFGLNGSGKTSLLTILHSALAGDASSLRKVPFREAVVKIYSVTDREVFTRSIKQQIPPAPRTQQHALFPGDVALGYEGRDVVPQVSSDTEQTAWTTVPEKGSKDSWYDRYLPTSRLWASSQIPFQATLRQYSYRGAPFLEPDMTTAEEHLNVSFQASIERLWSGYVHGVLRQVRSAQEEGLTSILKEVLGAQRREPNGVPLDSDSAYNRVQSFLARQQPPAKFGSRGDFEKRYRKSSILRNVVSCINEVEIGIEAAMAPRVALDGLISRMFARGKRVKFTDTAIEIETTDKTKISLASLSSGEKHALRILIETLYAENGPLLIDEPELSMHVDWQKELIPSMQSVNKDAQLILATHSPEIMAPVPDDRIFRI
jgi:predicted ATPase